MKKKGYHILEILTGLLLAAAVAMTISVVMQVSSKGYVTLNGYSLFKVATGSMEPTIETGSLLICKDTEIEDIRVKDIVCFESTNPMMLGQVITHRVVAIDDIGGTLRLTTRGDANTVEDALYVTDENLIGVVTAYSSDSDLIASMISFMTGKIGFLSCIVLPVLLVSAMIMKESMQSINREIRELKRLEKMQKQTKPMEEDQELIERLKKEIREELGLNEPEENEQ